MNAVTVNDDGLVLRLYIQPKASRYIIIEKVILRRYGIMFV